jgi:hypothetical protein
MKVVDGYPSGRVAEVVMLSLGPAIVTLIPIRAYVLLRRRGPTFVAFLFAVVLAVIAEYMTVFGAFILIDVALRGSWWLKPQARHSLMLPVERTPIAKAPEGKNV